MNSALLELEFDQLVIFLARTAIRAGPIWRHVFPLGAGRDARIGIAERLVVDMTADQAHVFLHQSVGFCVGVKSNSTKFIQAGARRPSPAIHEAQPARDSPHYRICHASARRASSRLS